MRTYCVILCQNNLLLTSVGFMNTIDSRHRDAAISILYPTRRVKQLLY